MMKLDKLKGERIFDFVITNPRTVDKEGDVVPEKEVGESLDIWLMHDAPINDSHTNRKIGKGLRWWQEPDGKIMARGVIDRLTNIADDVWNRMSNDDVPEKEKLKMVSIGGGAFGKVENSHGGHDLNNLEIVEVSVCHEGMHPDADIIGVNSLAKGAIPWFAKGNIVSTRVIRNNEPEKITLTQCADAQGIIKNKETKEVKNVVKEVEVKKDINQIIDQIVSLLTQLKTSSPEAAGNPPIAAPVAQAKEEPEEEKPVEETKKQETDGGDSGAKPVNPNPEGGKVKLPKSVDDERAEVGEAGDEAGDKGDPVVAKLIKDMADIKKAMPKSSVTPNPMIQKSFGVKHSDPSTFAMDVAMGKVKFNQSAVYKQREKDRLTSELNRMQEFDSYIQKSGGAFK